MDLEKLFDDVARLIESASKEDLQRWHEEAIAHSCNSYLLDDPD